MNFKKIVSAVSALAISVSAFVGLGVTAQAETTTLLEYGTGDVAWTAENLATWTAGGSPALADGIVTISGGNGSYETKKTIAPTANSVIDVEAVWRGASSTGRAFTASNGSYFRFGNIIVAQNDQDKKHGYGFTGLNNIGSVTTFTAGSYRVDVTSSAWLKINMEIDTATNTLTSFTITSEDGNTTYASASDVTLSSPDYTTVAFGYKKGGSVGTTNKEQLKSVKITQTTQEVQSADYTVQYVNQDGGAEVKAAETRSSVVGTTPALTDSDTASIAATETTPKYVYVSDDASEKSIASDGTTVVTVVYREAAKYNYAVNASTGAAIASGNLYEGDSATVAYPQYQLVDGTLYEAAKHNDSAKQYNWTFTPDADNYVLTIPYAATAKTDVVYLTEGEDIEGTTKASLNGNSANVGIRSSNSQAAYAPADVTITTLPAGYYKLEGVIFSGSSGNNLDFNFQLGDNVYTENVKGSSNWIGFESEPMLITEESALVLKASGSGTALLDYVYVVKTGEYEAPATASVSATSDIKDNYITFKGEIANVDDIATVTKAGFGFVNLSDAVGSTSLQALWTENDLTGNTFGTAIEQQTGATKSAFYGIPYIVIGDEAIFGTIVASDWNE